MAIAVPSDLEVDVGAEAKVDISCPRRRLVEVQLQPECPRPKRVKLSLEESALVLDVPERATAGDYLMLAEAEDGSWSCSIKSGSGSNTAASGKSPAATTVNLEQQRRFDALVAAARQVEGAFWSPKLKRACLTEPGVFAEEVIQEGEILCSMPAGLLLSQKTCRDLMPDLFAAVEALPCSNAEVAREIAHTTCLARLLSAAQVGGGWNLPTAPELWRHCAETLLNLDFVAHPFLRALSDVERLRCRLEPSGEVEHVAAAARHAQAVWGCVSEGVPREQLGGVDQKLFLQAWLCLLTRECCTPDGSAVAPLVDHFNHTSNPGAVQEWDERAQGGSGAVVVKACRALAVGEEICFEYACLSNPLLYRTYGFTVHPAEEPMWTCTFLEGELLSLCGSVVPQAMEDKLASLPNVHLDASRCTDTLAMVLQAFAQGCGRCSQPLRELCSRRARRLEQDATLSRSLAALGQARAHGSAAWWERLHDVQPAAQQEDEHAFRVKMSEYLCLSAHLEALDCAAEADVPPAGPLLAEGAELREDLKVVLNALERPSRSADASEKAV